MSQGEVPISVAMDQMFRIAPLVVSDRDAIVESNVSRYFSAEEHARFATFLVDGTGPDVDRYDLSFRIV